jgi:hypothetical protein
MSGDDDAPSQTEDSAKPTDNAEGSAGALQIGAWRNAIAGYNRPESQEYP